MKRNKPTRLPSRIMPKRGKNRVEAESSATTTSAAASSSDSDSSPRQMKRKKATTCNSSATASTTPLASSSTVNNAAAAASSPRDRDSPEANCSICLGSIEDRAFTNACYHTFCFECLVEWSRVRAVCPLCKKVFKSIVHKIESYDKYVLYDVSDNVAGSFAPHNANAGTTRAQDNAYLEAQRNTSQQQFAGSMGLLVASHITFDHLFQASLTDNFAAEQMIAFRRRIYTDPDHVQLHGVWTAQGYSPLPSRHISPTMFNCYPVMLERLRPWIRRDLVIIVGDSRAAEVETVVLHLLRRFPITSEDFYLALFPHLGLHTRRFLQELQTFATSPFDLTTYDSRVMYTSSAMRSGTDSDRRTDHSYPSSSRLVENISSSDESDVEIVSPLRTLPRALSNSHVSVDTPSTSNISRPQTASLTSCPALPAATMISTANPTVSVGSPTPGPSRLKFLMPHSENSSSSLFRHDAAASETLQHDEIVDNRLARRGTTLEQAVILDCDSDNDVFVIDDDHVIAVDDGAIARDSDVVSSLLSRHECHSPILLLSSSDDEASESLRERSQSDRRHKRTKGHQHSAPATDCVDEMQHIDRLFAAAFSAMQKHSRKSRLADSDSDSDSDLLSRCEQTSSEHRLSDPSSPSPRHRRRSSSVEIIDDRSSTVRSERTKKFVLSSRRNLAPVIPEQPASPPEHSSDRDLAMTKGESMPATLEQQSGTTQGQDIVEPKAESVPSTFKSQPPCKKHISGHKSSKHKLVMMPAIDASISPKNGTPDQPVCDLSDAANSSSIHRDDDHVAASSADCPVAVASDSVPSIGTDSCASISGLIFKPLESCIVGNTGHVSRADDVHGSNSCSTIDIVSTNDTVQDAVDSSLNADEHLPSSPSNVVSQCLSHEDKRPGVVDCPSTLGLDSISDTSLAHDCASHPGPTLPELCNEDQDISAVHNSNTHHDPHHFARSESLQYALDIPDVVELDNNEPKIDIEMNSSQSSGIVFQIPVYPSVSMAVLPSHQDNSALMTNVGSLDSAGNRLLSPSPPTSGSSIPALLVDSETLLFAHHVDPSAFSASSILPVPIPAYRPPSPLPVKSLEDLIVIDNNDEYLDVNSSDSSVDLESASDGDDSESNSEEEEVEWLNTSVVESRHRCISVSSTSSDGSSVIVSPTSHRRHSPFRPLPDSANKSAADGDQNLEVPSLYDSELNDSVVVCHEADSKLGIRRECSGSDASQEPESRLAAATPASSSDCRRFSDELSADKDVVSNAGTDLTSQVVLPSADNETLILDRRTEMPSLCSSCPTKSPDHQAETSDFQLNSPTFCANDPLSRVTNLTDDQVQDSLDRSPSPAEPSCSLVLDLSMPSTSSCPLPTADPNGSMLSTTRNERPVPPDAENSAGTTSSLTSESVRLDESTGNYPCPDSSEARRTNAASAVEIGIPVISEVRSESESKILEEGNDDEDAEYCLSTDTSSS